MMKILNGLWNYSQTELLQKELEFPDSSIGFSIDLRETSCKVEIAQHFPQG